MGTGAAARPSPMSPSQGCAPANGRSPQLKAATSQEIQVLNNAQNSLPGNIPLQQWWLRDVFQARRTPCPPMPRWRDDGSRRVTAAGCHPSPDDSFQPKYWTAPCTTEAEGAGSQCRHPPDTGGLARPRSCSPAQERVGWHRSRGTAGWCPHPAPLEAAPNLPSVFAADPHPLHQDKRKMRLTNWGTTARRDRWPKHPATSCVYLSLAEKVRTQAGVSPAPGPHCRAAAPSTTSTASLMGKGWFSFQKPSGTAAPGCATVPGLPDA